MAVAINKDYITNLPYKQERELGPVDGKQFIEALIDKYGRKQVLEIAHYLMISMPNNHSGTQAFKDRFEASVASPEKPLSVADQKYIADMTQRIAAGHIRIA